MTEALKYFRDNADQLIPIACMMFLSGCASSPPEVKELHFSGEAAIGVKMDIGHAEVAVEYHALTPFGPALEVVHCPVVEVDIVLTSSLGTYDILLQGVPPQAIESAPIDDRCFDEFGAFGARERLRRPGEVESDGSD